MFDQQKLLKQKDISSSVSPSKSPVSEVSGASGGPSLSLDATIASAMRAMPQQRNAMLTPSTGSASSSQLGALIQARFDAQERRFDELQKRFDEQQNILQRLFEMMAKTHVFVTSDENSPPADEDTQAKSSPSSLLDIQFWTAILDAKDGMKQFYKFIPPASTEVSEVQLAKIGKRLNNKRTNFFECVRKAIARTLDIAAWNGQAEHAQRVRKCVLTDVAKLTSSCEHLLCSIEKRSKLLVSEGASEYARASGTPAVKQQRVQRIASLLLHAVFLTESHLGKSRFSHESATILHESIVPIAAVLMAAKMPDADADEPESETPQARSMRAFNELVNFHRDRVERAHRTQAIPLRSLDSSAENEADAAGDADAHEDAELDE